VRDIYPKFDTELAKVVDQALGKVSEDPMIRTKIRSLINLTTHRYLVSPCRRRPPPGYPMRQNRQAEHFPTLITPWRTLMETSHYKRLAL
jgi:hypothetical protein